MAAGRTDRTARHSLKLHKRLLKKAHPTARHDTQPAARRREKPRRDDRRGPPQRPPRTGAYEKRAAKKVVPITEAMAEGKEYLRSFGDLLQFHKKKNEPDSPAAKPNDQSTPPADGSTPAE